MFLLVPVKRLSAHKSSWPSSRRRSIKCEPRNPAPPVTKIRFRLSYNRAKLSSKVNE